MESKNLEKEIQAQKKRISIYIKHSKAKLNSNKKNVEMVLKGLANNKIKHGHSYCPCKVITEDREKDIDIICPCKEFREENKCICGLFVTKI